MKFAEVQTEAEKRLKADSFFSAIDVIPEKVGDISNKVETRIARLKVAVLILTPAFQLVGKEGSKGCLMRVLCSVNVVENTTTHTANPHVFEVIENVIRVLHGSTADDGRSYTFYLTSDVIRMLPLEGNLVTYPVNFYVHTNVSGKES